MSLKNVLRTLLVTAAVGVLGACGGGGGGSTVSNTVVSGVVSKGIFTSGTVRVYAVEADGTQGAVPLKEEAIKAGGVYTADLGRVYSGPIVVRAFGTYLDEATGASVSIPESAPLSAAVASVTENPTVVVTPLTDLAVREATSGDKLSVSGIAAANSAVAALFGVDNIISTKPVLFEAAALTAATAPQRKYTEVLALVSQYVSNASGANPTSAALQSSLSELSSGIAVTGGAAAFSSVEVTAALTGALNSVLANPVTSAVLAADVDAKSNLLPATGTAGSKILKYTLKVEGAAASSVYAVQAAITLPEGITVENGETTNRGIVSLSSWFFPAVAKPPTVLSVSAAASNVLTVGIGFSAPFADATFATLYFKVPAATAVPAASAFAIDSANRVKDIGGAPLAGAVVAISEGTVIGVQ